MWLDDVIAPSLLQGIDVNKPVPPQFDIGREELLGEVPQVPVSAPSGSANDYAGFIVQEDLDSLLLKASQVFKRVNVEGSDKLEELFLQASQITSSPNTGLWAGCLTCQLQETVLVEKGKFLSVASQLAAA